MMPKRLHYSYSGDRTGLQFTLRKLYSLQAHHFSDETMLTISLHERRMDSNLHPVLKWGSGKNGERLTSCELDLGGGSP